MHTVGNLALADPHTVRILGLDIRRARPQAKARVGDVTAHPSTSQGVWTPYFSGYIARVVSPSLFEVLRESLPVLDAAIDRLVTLDGVPEIEGDNEALVAEIREWAENVQCGDTEIGLPAFVRNWRNEIHEQGFGLGEWVYSDDGRDIVRLNVADSKAVHFGRKKDDSLGVYFSPKYRPRYVSDAATDGVNQILSGRAASNLSASVLTDQGFKELDMSNKRIMAYRSENGGDPYGVSLMRSMEFVSKTLLTIQNGMLNSWERFGDPSFHIHYQAAGRVSADELETRRKTIASNFAAAITGKRAGQTADFVTAVDKDSEMTISVIGHEGQVLDIEMPARHVLEQIVAKTGLPPWMLGLIWGTSERLAKFQSELLKQESDTRTSFERPHVEAVIAAMLRARGRTWKTGDWRVEYNKPNLSDEVAKAQAKFMNAQADAVTANAGLTDGQSITIHTGNDGGTDNGPSNVLTFAPKSQGQNHSPAAPAHPCARGIRASCPSHKDTKENQHHDGCNHSRPFASIRGSFLNLETRPIPNPAMDRVENDAVSGLAELWAQTAAHVVSIMGLPTDAPKAGMTDSGFAFTAADKAKISEALAGFTAEAFANDGGDMGPMQLAYLRAWAQGAIDAYVASGLAAPIGELTNDAAVNELRGVAMGSFATNIDTKFTPKLWRILEAGTSSGANPMEIAAMLHSEFDGFAWKWEQIARSEVGIAHDRARKAEWQAEVDAEVITDKFDWIPAPDACPICMAMVQGFNGHKAPYTLATMPRLVLDTHPSDRCAIAPHVGK